MAGWYRLGDGGAGRVRCHRHPDQTRGIPMTTIRQWVTALMLVASASVASADVRGLTTGAGPDELHQQSTEPLEEEKKESGEQSPVEEEDEEPDCE